MEWSDEDNERWLAELKRQAGRLPDSILRAARADRLRKESDRLEVEGAQIKLVTERSGVDWPRLVTLANEAGVGLLGLSRLSGHSFYVLNWEGGLRVRRFEVSGTSRNRLKFEHIELATLLAEALGAEYELQPEPVTADQVEAAYLRRLKAEGAELGPPPEGLLLPRGVAGRYRVGEIRVTMLVGQEVFAYAARIDPEGGVLLRREQKRGGWLLCRSSGVESSGGRR